MTYVGSGATQCDNAANKFFIGPEWADDDLKAIRGKYSSTYGLTEIILVWSTRASSTISLGAPVASGTFQMYVVLPDNDPIVEMTAYYAGSSATNQVLHGISLKTFGGVIVLLGVSAGTNSGKLTTVTSQSGPIIGFFGCKVQSGRSTPFSYGAVYPLIRTPRAVYQVSASSSSEGSSDTVAVGVGVGVAAFVLICVLVGIAIFILYRRNQRTRLTFA